MQGPTPNPFTYTAHAVKNRFMRANAPAGAAVNTSFALNLVPFAGLADNARHRTNFAAHTATNAFVNDSKSHAASN